MHDLPSSEQMGKKSIRLSSPPPDSELPSELRKMSYRELNRQCLSSYSSTGSASGSESIVQTMVLSDKIALRELDFSPKVDFTYF